MDIINTVFDFIMSIDLNFVLFALIAIIVMILYVRIMSNIWSSNSVNELLTKHLKDKIEDDSHYIYELKDCCTELSIRAFEQKGDSIYTCNGRLRSVFCELEHVLRKRFAPLVLVPINKKRTSGITFHFHNNFREYVKRTYPSAVVGDFYDILISYFEYLNDKQGLCSDVFNVEEHNRRQSEKIAAKIKNIFDEQQNDKSQEVDIQQTKVLPKVDEIQNDQSSGIETSNTQDELQERVEQEPDAEPVANTTFSKTQGVNVLKMPNADKKKFVTAYNSHIALIKENYNKGMLPTNTKHITKEFYNYLCSLPIISHQRLVSINESGNAPERLGCYIIFNTYTNKYFVGKAHSPVEKAYLTLKSGIVTGDRSLQRDYAEGHMMLVKEVPLLQSCYDSINNLQQALVFAYESLYPMGYN